MNRSLCLKYFNKFNAFLIKRSNNLFFFKRSLTEPKLWNISAKFNNDYIHCYCCTVLNLFSLSFLLMF